MTGLCWGCHSLAAGSAGSAAGCGTVSLQGAVGALAFVFGSSCFGRSHGLGTLPALAPSFFFGIAGAALMGTA